MSGTVCWLMDYYLEECKQGACIRSSKPLHPCVLDDEPDKEESDAS